MTGLARKTFSLINAPNFFKSSHTSYLPAYEDGTECSETSAYKIQTPGKHPEESTQHSELGENLKSGTLKTYVSLSSASVQHTDRTSSIAVCSRGDFSKQCLKQYCKYNDASLVGNQDNYLLSLETKDSFITTLTN